MWERLQPRRELPMNKLQATWIVIFSSVLVWSGIGPHDYPTWLLEVAPAIVAAAVLWFTRERFPLTRLTYVLILIHCIILMVGGHYTYAEVPLGEWVREAFDQIPQQLRQTRSFRTGIHVPAIIAREILIRKKRHQFSWLARLSHRLCLRWRSAHSMNSSNGGWRCCQKTPPTHFSAHKATSGIRNLTCGWRCSGLCRHWYCLAACTTGNYANSPSCV